MNRYSYKQSGFTVVELMIATAIFSVILLLISTAIIQIGRSYYKGLNETNTSAIAGSLVNEISEGIKFSGKEVELGITRTVSGSTWHGFCIGGTAYTYMRGIEVGDPTNNGGLVSYEASGCNAASLLDPGAAMSEPNARQLLSKGMRVSNLDVQETGDNYKIDVRILNGPDDLLCSDSLPAGKLCIDDHNMNATELAAKTDTRCKQRRSDGYFCSMSQLRTSINRRVE